jgi:hypothetical protein
MPSTRPTFTGETYEPTEVSTDVEGKEGERSDLCEIVDGSPPSVVGIILMMACVALILL